MALTTAPINLTTTGPIPHPSAPYQRATAIRHRKRPHAWIVQAAARHAVLWVAQPIRTTRARYVGFAAGCAAGSVLGGVLLAAVIR